MEGLKIPATDSMSIAGPSAAKIYLTILMCLVLHETPEHHIFTKTARSALRTTGFWLNAGSVEAVQRIDHQQQCLALLAQASADVAVQKLTCYPFYVHLKWPTLLSRPLLGCHM